MRKGVGANLGMFSLLTSAAWSGPVALDLALFAGVACMSLSLSALEAEHPVCFVLTDAAYDAEVSEGPGLSAVALLDKR